MPQALGTQIRRRRVCDWPPTPGVARLRTYPRLHLQTASELPPNAQLHGPLIDGFGALNIYEVSYVGQKLREIKSAFKKDYDRNIQYVKFFKKVNKQVKTKVIDDVKGGAKGRRSRAHFLESKTLYSQRLYAMV